jgi:hypothetical protein
MSETTSKKRKLSLPLVIAGGVSSLVLALGMSPTFSAFTAQIANNVNTANAGTLIMQETPTTGTPCNSNDAPKTLANNDASCTINLFGNATMYPGQTVNTTVTIKNTGTITPTVFSLTPGTCTPTLGTPNGGVALANVCAKFNVRVYAGADTSGTVLNSLQQTAATFVTPLGGLTPLTANGGSQQYTISVQLDTTADNTYQGVSISMPLTWKFQA